MNRQTILTLMTSIALGIASTAGALGDDQLSSQTMMKILITSGMGGSPTYEQVLATLSRPIRLYDRNGDGLSADELDAADQIRMAAQRAQLAQRFLPADLNGDQRVSRDEYALTRIASPNLGMGQRDSFDDVDTNKDGFIDWKEMTAQPQSAPLTRPNVDTPKAMLFQMTLAIDPTPATNLTLDDAKQLTDEMFALLDKDKNGVLDPTETSPIFARPVSVNGGTCAFPPSMPDQAVVAVGAYEGQSFASAYLDNPSQPTYAVTVNVEPGDQAIYFVGSSSASVIWTFTGAVGRVRQVALTGQGAQAASGIKKELVSLLGKNCIGDAHDLTSGAGISAKQRLMSMLGRSNILIAGAYALDAVSVPSLKISTLDTPRDAPARVTTIDVASVVSQKPAQKYEVLPDRAGLEQLVASGQLNKTGDRTYRVVSAIPYYPGGLTGSNAVRFIIAKGVPVPGGSPGHSCVISEDTGQPLVMPMLCKVN